MIFITGGYRAGKKQFAITSLQYNKEMFSNNIYDDTKVIYDLQELQNIDITTTDITSILKLISKKEVIICNELGCGVVPIDKDLRKKRNFIGKLCIEIAKQSDEVYRVYAGIGVKIK